MKTLHLRQLLIALIALGLCAGCEKSPEHHKQTAKVVLLPDTPPPPPPPPPKEAPPPPKDQQKEVNVQPKQAEPTPQQAEQLKMDGPAGDGPSAFAAGTITQDYSGQKLGGDGSGGGIARAEFATYRTRLQRVLQEELARMKELKGVDYRVPALVRMAPDTHAWSVSLGDSTGDKQVDEALRTVLSRVLQKEPPPASAPANGFDVRVTNKLL